MGWELATLNSMLTAFIAYCTWRMGYDRGFDDGQAIAKRPPASTISDGPEMEPPFWML